jgi:predicted ATPase/DNA-binding SARP family transcriptional activator
VRIRVLGPLAVSVDGHVVTIAAPKQRALLAALVAAEGLPVAAERLIEELWTDEPPPTAATALQVHVSGLRKQLGGAISTHPTGYQLDIAAEDVDARTFVAELAKARELAATDLPAAATRLAEALKAWRGGAYEGLPAGPAVRAAATRLDHLRLAALTEWAAWELQLGEHVKVAAELAPLLAAEPAQERLAAPLMLALYRGDRMAEARTVYAELTRALGTLDLEPSEATAELAAAIARRDPTLQPPAGSLPAPANRFIGRRRELDRLAELLGRSRLLTLTGPGGSGKTRLAIELARETAPAHPDGVFLVELAGITTAEPITARLADALGLREKQDEPIIAWLKPKRALIVLDNCEHLLGNAAELATKLLRECAGLRILATSREPLAVDGETLWSLGGLDRSDAIRLLVERVHPGFRLPPQEVETAVALCTRLDGLPLAIELVAAHLRILSLKDVAARLDRRFDLLTAAAHRNPDRHRTMRAAIDWSYQLLDGPQQELFKRLSVFASGFTLAAAEYVGQAELPQLRALVDRSMVVAKPAEARFVMLETMQAYAAELGDLSQVRDLHLTWYRDLVAQVPVMGGDDHATWLALLNAEHDNLRVALGHAIDTDPAAALSMTAGLWWFWWVTGQMAEGRAWLDRALANSDNQPAALKAPALRAAASLTRNSGDYDAGRSYGERALELYQELGDTAGIAAALNGLCMTSQAQGDYQASLRFGEESEQLARKAGNPRGIAAALNNIGCTLRVMGRLDDAAARFAEALDGFRAIADRRGEAAALTNLGIVARRRGDLAMSRRLSMESLSLYRQLEIKEGQLDMVEAMACLEVAEGRHREALRLLLVAERERAALGAPVFTPDEVADRDAALAAARAAVGDIAAPTATLATVVAELLTGS